MDDDTQKAFAHFGLERLKKSVLQVLYDAHVFRERGFLGFNDIHEALDINRIPKTKDYFVHGILLRLWKDGHAERTGYGRWKITPQGIAFIDGNGNQ